MSYVLNPGSGGGGTPGGSDKDVQFNDGGSFGGDSDFTFDKTAGAEQVKISASSSTELVKITQTGTGRAFLVEDSASPDSTPFSIDHTGKVGIGIAPGGGFALRTDASGNIQAGNNGFMNAGRFTSRSNGSTSSTCFSRDIDQDTGMYFPGTNEVGFSTAGNERLRFGSAGQIGLAGANYGTSGQVLTSGGPGAPVSWQNAGGASGYRQVVTTFGAIKLPFVPSSNPPTSYPVMSVGSTSISDDITFAPWIFRESVTLRGIGYYAESSAVSKPVALAIYESDANGLPSTKVTNSDASITPAIAGAQLVTMAAGPSGLTLSAGFYWCALVNTTTGDIVNIRSHGNAGSVVGASVYNRTTLMISSGTSNSLPSSLSGSTFAQSYATALMFASVP